MMDTRDSPMMDFLRALKQLALTASLTMLRKSSL